MLHEIKYRIITIYRDRQAAFWSLLFPIILGTLFSLAFGNFGKDIDTIDTAIVKEDTSDSARAFENYLKEIEKSDPKVIKLKVMSDKKAKQSLKKGNISGIYYVKEKPELTVTDSDMQVSILKELLSEYDQNVSLYKDIAKEHPEKLEEIIKDNSYYNMSKEVGISGKEVHGVVQYYFALIAMACLFGGYVGYTIGIQLQANINKVAIRRNISSFGKLKMIVCDTLVGWGVQTGKCVGMSFISQIYFKNRYRKQYAKNVAVCMVGSLIGVSSGIFIGCLGNMSYEFKIGVITTYSILSSFLAGLMIAQIKGAIEKYCPIVNRINPAALISDAIYSMDIYDEPSRFNLDMFIMIFMAVLFTGVSFLIMRRKRYDSI